MKILITGTPGVGKTTLSEYLSKKYNLYHIDISKYIIKNKLYIEYDQEDDTHDFDIDYVAENLEKEIQRKGESLEFKGVVVDTHTPDICENIKFDFIFVIRSNLKQLKQILVDRKYCEKKISDNLECEILEEILLDTREIFGDDSCCVIGSEEKIITREELFEEAVNKIEPYVPK